MKDDASRDCASRDFASGDGASRGDASRGDGASRGFTNCAGRAQHYHDLALEFLVMMRFAGAAQVRERYRMMGQHYLARAGAELARAREDRPAASGRRKRRRAARKTVSGWAQAADVFQLDRHLEVPAAKAL